MKKIQRYTVGTADPEAIVKDNKGWLVSYDDYAALAADKEAETKALFDAIRLITQLRDENERLRRDADAFFNLWLAAKGGQS